MRSFKFGKLEQRNEVEKKLILVGISRNLFTHSLPLSVAEQLYVKLLKETRNLIVEANGKKKQDETYQLLLGIIEEFNLRLLSGKVYWNVPEEKEEYKKFWDKYQEIDKMKKSNYLEYVKQREILFVRADLKKLSASKKDYSKIIKFYKQKLVENDDMKTLKCECKTLDGKFTKVIQCEVKESATKKRKTSRTRV